MLAYCTNWERKLKMKDNGKISIDEMKSKREGKGKRNNNESELGCKREKKD